MSRFFESVDADAALDYLEGLGYAVLHGPDLASGELGAERSESEVRLRPFFDAAWDAVERIVRND